MKVLFSAKIFEFEFLPDLYLLKYPESKKVTFENWSVHMYLCVCVHAYKCEYMCGCVGNIQRFISQKSNRIRKTKLYTQDQISVWIILPGFGKNLKTGIGG